MRKKTIEAISSLLTVAMLSASLAGCSSGSSASSAASGSAAGSSAGAASGGEIKVGVVAPISGSMAMVGDTEVKGVQLAVKEINAAGGIGGKQITLVSADDEGDPKTAVSAANKLISSDQVSAIIGTVNSSCTLAMEQVTESAEIPLITPISSGISITDPKNKFIARLQASDKQQATAITQYALNDLKYNKIAVMYQSDDYGTGGKDVVLQVLKDAGVTPVDVEAFDPSATDMNSQLVKIKQANPQAIIMWTMYTPAASIAKQAKQLGMTNVTLMGGGGLTNAKLYTLAGSAAVGICNTQTFFPDKSKASAKAAAFIDAYNTAYGKTPDSNAAMSYDSMMVLAEGLKAAPDLKGEAIMTGIKAVKDLPLVTGNISIDTNGDANRDIHIIKLGDGGKYEMIK